MFKKEILQTILIMLFTLVLYFFLEAQVVFSPDVSYLLHVSKQILQGGHYATDIFETNPPMILYLYMPIVGLTKLVGMHLHVATQVYMIVLAVFSSSLCLYYLKKIIVNANDYHLSLFFFSLWWVFIIFPVFMFAQREHVYLLLVMPYIFSTALTLENKKSHPWLAVCVGLLAGLGFAMKPYFLPTVCILELLFILQKRKIFAWVRIESLMIMGVLISYFLSILVLQPEYLLTVLPFVSKYYFFMIKTTWGVMLLTPAVDFCLLVVMLYPFYRHYDKYRTLGLVMYAALLGMMLAFIIPKNVWYYHVYPAFSLAFLLMLHAMLQNFYVFFTNIPKKSFLALGMLMVLYIPLSVEYHFFHAAVEYKKTDRAMILTKIFNNISGDRTINCLTSGGTASCFPALHEIDRAHYQSRFPFLWWYPGLVTRQEENAKNTDASKSLAADEKYLVEAVADDLLRYKSRWVVIDKKSFSPKHDILTYLQKNKKFNDAWRHYNFYMSVEEYEIYTRNK